MKSGRLITQRRAKWVGLLATLFLALAMVASNWYEPSYTRASPLSSNSWRVRIVPGGLDVFHTDNQLNFGVQDFIEDWERDLDFQRPLSVASPDRFVWLPKYNSQSSMPFVMRIVTIPLWLPIFLIALPTVYLWRTDRAKPWQCAKCRYDLRGLAGGGEGGGEGGVCPECGKPFAADM